MDLSTFLIWTNIAQIVLPFVLCAALVPLERAFPRRPDAAGTAAPRWRANALIALAGVFVGIVVTELMADRLGSVGVSLRLVSIAGLPIAGLGKLIVALLIMDFLAYLLHVLSHRIGGLWRLHLVHHSDNHFDSSTGLRHQPLEGAINLCVLTICYAALGLPLVAIAIYGVAFAIHSVFSHANIAIPQGVERWLRLVIVTPDLHRIHHSADPDDYDRNYGQILPWWDRAFGTLRAAPAQPLAELRLGAPEVGDCTRASAMELALLPFRSSKAVPKGLGPPRGRAAPRPAKGVRRAGRKKN